MISEEAVSQIAKGLGDDSYSLRSSDKFELRAHNPNRIYAKYLFSNGVFDKVVFVKTGPVYNVPIDRFMGGCDNPFFFSPRQLAAFKDGGKMVAAWEFVDGDHPTTANEDPIELTRIACAIAGVNGTTAAARNADLPIEDRTPWVEPVAPRLEEWARTKDSPAISGQVADFIQREPQRLARFTDLGRSYVTHHDIKDGNLILPHDDKRVAVIDWGTVTMAPAGSGIRFACRFGENTRRLVAEAYTAAMRKLGADLNIRDVLCAMETHQIYWYVFTGLKLGLGRRIVLGLKLANGLEDRI